MMKEFGFITYYQILLLILLKEILKVFQHTTWVGALYWPPGKFKDFGKDGNNTAG